MVAPSDEMNEEQHLRPLSIFNIDDNFVISKKTGTFIFPSTAVCSFNHCHNIKRTLLNTPTSGFGLEFSQGFFFAPTLTTTVNSVYYNLIFQRITHWKWQPRISPSHDYGKNCNCDPWLQEITDHLVQESVR
jgi:hypothetical protein